MEQVTVEKLAHYAEILHQVETDLTAKRQGQAKPEAPQLDAESAAAVEKTVQQYKSLYKVSL